MNRISTAVGRMAVVFCLMLAVNEAAAAQDTGTDTRSVKISLQGIDLGTAAGQEQARQRIAYVVRRDFGASNSGSIIPSTDATASGEAILAAAMSKLQRLETAATRPASFTVAASTRH